MNLTTIRSEGLLLSYDLLTKIASGEAPGQRPSDFGLDGRVRLSDEITVCWSEARDYWKAFQHSVQRLDPKETGASALSPRPSRLSRLLDEMFTSP